MNGIYHRLRNFLWNFLSERTVQQNLTIQYPPFVCLSQIFNGLLERKDADAAIKTPVGILPGEREKELGPEASDRRRCAAVDTSMV